jgi:hypothetical protein
MHVTFIVNEFSQLSICNIIFTDEVKTGLGRPHNFPEAAVSKYPSQD